MSKQGKYAVAVTLRSDISNGIKIVTRLNIYEALNVDEAVGKAVAETSVSDPNYSIFQISKMEIAA